MKTALEGVPGVKQVALDFDTATVLYEGGEAVPEQLVKAVQKEGYEARLLEEIVLRIEGMGCAHCAERIESSLVQVPGVWSVSLDPERKEALVAFEKGKMGGEELVAAVRGASTATAAFTASMVRRPTPSSPPSPGER